MQRHHHASALSCDVCQTGAPAPPCRNASATGSLLQQHDSGAAIITSRISAQQQAQKALHACYSTAVAAAVGQMDFQQMPNHLRRRVPPEPPNGHLLYEAPSWRGAMHVAEKESKKR